MEIADLPARNPEGWAVVDLMGHRRLVGRVLLVRLADVPMLEVEQPEIRASQNSDFDPTIGDRVLLSTHKLMIHLQAVYSITPVPDEAHCVNAFFESNSMFDGAENPGRWSPDADEEDRDEDDQDYPQGYSPV